METLVSKKASNNIESLKAPENANKFIDKLIEIKRKAESNFFQVACGLRLVKIMGLWQLRKKENGTPFKDFYEWATRELGIESPRTVEMMIQLVELVFEKILPEGKMGTEEGEKILQKVTSIEWSKALLLLRKVKDAKEFDLWLPRAKELTRQELAKLLAGSREPKESLLETFSVKVTSAQKEIILKAIEKARTVASNVIGNGSPVENGYLLTLICRDFLGDD